MNIYVIILGVASKGNDDIELTDLDLQRSIKEKFLVDMPQDFYDFWEFCKDLNCTCPEGII